MKTSEIWVFDATRGKQMFFIHSIRDRAFDIIMSGINEYNSIIYQKSNHWSVIRKASEEEERRFYQLIEERGYKFNRNTGIERC